MRTEYRTEPHEWLEIEMSPQDQAWGGGVFMKIRATQHQQDILKRISKKWHKKYPQKIKTGFSTRVYKKLKKNVA